MKKDVNRGLLRFALTVLLLMGLSACDSGERAYNSSTNPAVVKQADALLDAIKIADYDLAIKKYPDSYFVKQTREGWKKKLKALNDERGAMKSYELKKSQADTRFSGKFFILEYMVIHQGNKRVNHIITLLAPVMGGAIELIGHKMTPWIDDRMDAKGNLLPVQKDLP